MTDKTLPKTEENVHFTRINSTHVLLFNSTTDEEEMWEEEPVAGMSMEFK